MFPLFTEMPFTYLICGLIIISSVTGFYYKPYYYLLIFHPYKVFKGERMHTLFTSAFVHTGWWHLIFNVYVFYNMSRDIEYVFMEKSPGFIENQGICLLLFALSILFSNIIVGYKQKNNLAFTSVGASAAVFAFMGFVSTYYPIAHLKSRPTLIPLYYGYEFTFVFIIITALFFFRKSKNSNNKAHFYGLIMGIITAVFLRFELVGEIINNIKLRL